MFIAAAAASLHHQLRQERDVDMTLLTELVLDS